MNRYYRLVLGMVAVTVAAWGAVAATIELRRRWSPVLLSLAVALAAVTATVVALLVVYVPRSNMKLSGYPAGMTERTLSSQPQPACPRALVATLATGAGAVRELEVLAWSIRKWMPADTMLYVLTDEDGCAPVHAAVPWAVVVTGPHMQRYRSKKRVQLETSRGVAFDDMWTEFMYEKANVVQYVFSRWPALAAEVGVWFLDCDVVLLAPLPALEAPTELALAPHWSLRLAEYFIGRYNGGMLWIRNPVLLDVWRSAGVESHYFEQSALEALAKATSEGGRLRVLDDVDDFGPWTLMAGSRSQSSIIADLSVVDGRGEHTGVLFRGRPLRSIHFHSRSEKNDEHRHMKDVLRKLTQGSLDANIQEFVTVVLPDTHRP
jgi:hypothetical protein